MLIVEPIIIILSLWGYAQQTYRIRTMKSVGSFSIYVPGVMLVANILKIFFWFIEPFAFPLLLQAVLLVVIHLILLKSYIEFRGKQHIKNKDYFRSIWNWQNFYEYLLFLLGFSVLLGILTALAIKLDLPIIGQIFAYVSTAVEVYLAVPQIFSNYRNKSVAGVSRVMITLWTTNDSLKTGYFILNAQPIQFTITGVVQIALDIALIVQMLIYPRHLPPTETNSKKVN